MGINNVEFIKLSNGHLVNVAYITHVLPGSTGIYSVFIVGHETPLGFADGEDLERLKETLGEV
jgi:hypothetical protein